MKTCLRLETTRAGYDCTARAIVPHIKTPNLVKTGFISLAQPPLSRRSDSREFSLCSASKEAGVFGLVALKCFVSLSTAPETRGDLPAWGHSPPRKNL